MRYNAIETNHRKGAVIIMRKGGIFSVVGLVLGAVSAAVSITAIVFSAIGLVLHKKYARPRIR